MDLLKKCFLLDYQFFYIWICATPLSCISMDNQECKVRPEIFNVNSDKPVFYPFSNTRTKWSDSRNKIHDPCAKMCVPDVVKNAKKCSI